MLNAELVENFHAIYRQKQTGALTASGDDFTVRFMFQDGEVMAMDLGEDKEHLLADKLQEYHRLDAAQHALVFATREKVQGSVADIVRNLRLASDDEIAGSTRAMVEDALCHVFGASVRHLQFNPAQGIDSFNFERSAVRLRIPVETLLKTVGQRVSDIQDVLKAVGDWESIYAFAEGSEDAGALSDYEKHVLNFVDGHRSIEDIATACRDSSRNLARVLNGLAKKGVVRRLPSKLKAAQTTPAAGTPVPRQTASHVRGATEASADADAAQPAAAPAPVAPQPQTYTALPPQPIEPGPNWMLRGALVATLAAAVGVWWVVHNYNGRHEAFLAAQETVNDLASKHDWNAALTKLDEMREGAKGDLSQLEEIDKTRARLQAEMDAEVKQIDTLVDKSEYDDAGSRIARLPPDRQAAPRAKLDKALEAFKQASDSLAAEVTIALEAGDVAHANKLIELRPEHEGRAASDARGRWRVKKLEEARYPGASIEERQRALALVMDASPTEDQRQSIALIKDDIRRQEGRLADQIRHLQEMADKGDYEEALAEAKSLGTASVVRGNDKLEKAFQAFQSKCDKVKSDFAQLHDDTRTAIASSEGADRLKELIARGEQLLQAYPALKHRSENEEVVALLRDVADAVVQPPDVQPQVMAQIKDVRKLDTEFAAALTARMNRLNSAEAEANGELENARRLLRDGNLEGAERRYDMIIAKGEWSATAARRAAEKELSEARSQDERRKVAQKELAAAITAGDVDRANSIAREIGLKYLPLSVESSPAGAEIWQGGKKIGATPLVLDIAAAERVDFTAELRLPGYLPKSVSGAAAEGGWRVQAALERAPVAHADLGQVVTSHPAVVGARVWVANRSQAFAINPAGTVETVVYQGPGGPTPLNDPVYAPAVSSDAGIYFATRENVSLRIAKGVERVPQAAPSDHPPAIFESPELIDTRFLIVAGIDGVLHSVVETRPTQRWDGESGAPFAARPLLLGENVLTVRRDGRLAQVRAYNGLALGSAAIGAPVVSAWAVTGKGLAGVTANEAWAWDGAELVRAPLPQAAAAGAHDVIIGINGRAWIRSGKDWNDLGDGKDWNDLGRFDGAPTGEPVLWQGHVAVPSGATLRVLGPRGFTVTQSAEFLPPVVLGNRLFAICQNGQVAIYEP